MSDTSKTAKIIKRWYYSTAHWQLGDVMVSDITFLWFLLFSMCHSLHVAINKCINWCFVHLIISYHPHSWYRGLGPLGCSWMLETYRRVCGERGVACRGGKLPWAPLRLSAPPSFKNIKYTGMRHLNNSKTISPEEPRKNVSPGLAVPFDRPANLFYK